MSHRLPAILAAALIFSASAHAALPAVVLPAPDVAAALKADASKAGLQPFRFAVPIPVLITPDTHGTWSTEAGLPVWRFSLSVPGARHLNLGFTKYRLPQGASLRIAGGPDVRGPYGARHAAAGQLWTPIVRADSVQLELRLPSAASRTSLQLVLTQVGYGFRGFGAKDEAAAKSGSCNVDVACPDGDEWRDEIRSVARYSIAGALLCTGQLVNNTAGDFTPYFLTASHCLESHALAPTTVYYWNYETGSCGGTPDGNLDQTQIGALMVATSGAGTDLGSDFALVELLETPDPSFGVYYSGWDRRNLAPVGTITAIHHPAGDEKRISFEYDPVELAAYLKPGSREDTDATHIRIVDWDVGTTEGGSSGSGIWNEDHRLVGTLSGGYALCGNDDSDWYGRFQQHWSGLDTPLTSVASYLDPAGTGAEVLDGADPNGTPSSKGGTGSGSGFAFGGSVPALSLLVLALAALRTRRRR